MQRLVSFATYAQPGKNMSDIMAHMKRNAAIAALKYIGEGQVVGIGSGSTVNIFIEQLATIKNKIAGTVSSSEASTQLLKANGIPVLDFNSLDELPLYVDGTDAFNNLKQLVKGAGGFFTREKILATAAKKFICITDAGKAEGILGDVPVPVEVIPMARSWVARALVSLGGQPQYRSDFITDNGNIILDVFGLAITQPQDMERKINQITGVVENGIFAQQPADIILVGEEHEVRVL